MRRTGRLMAAVAAALLVVVPASVAQGAPGGGGRPDNPGQGQGQGGGKPDGAGSKKGDAYSDLWVIARDVDGVPITTQFTVEGETVTCVQPITFSDLSANPDVVQLAGANVYPYDLTHGDMPYLIPLVGEAAPELEMEPCDVDPAYLTEVSEVDLGRLNLGRSPEKVLAKQLRDVQTFLNSGEVALDASGRFVLVGTDLTLDSPLANLAVYQSVLETGLIQTPESPMPVPDVDLDELQLTATALAAGSPKEDFEITVDTVAYLNRILGIPVDTAWAEVMPVLPNVAGWTGETFLNYGGFAYDRADFFPGCVDYYDISTGTEREGVPLTTVVPFAGAATGSGVDGYVRLAEDARDVLVWVHARGENVHAVDPITQDGLCSAPAE
jgi:hypothetical protein